MYINYNRSTKNILRVIIFLVVTNLALAAPPSQSQVNIYSSLCNIGKLKNYELDLEMGLIGRRLVAGGGKFSQKELEQELPGIKSEKNRLLALEAYQDCVYRYVSRFHPAIPGDTPGTQKPSDPVFSPSVPEERKREIVFLANELENFKNQMQRMKSTLPDKYYDKRDSKEKYPKKDQRIIDISTYNRYKTFQTPSGVPDFSNLTNNDIVLLCTTFKSESDAYYLFYRDYERIFGLKAYNISREVTRICQAATLGR